MNETPHLPWCRTVIFSKFIDHSEGKKDCFNKKYAKTVSQFSKPHVVFIFSNFYKHDVYKLRQFKKKFTVCDFFGGCGASHI